MQFDFLSMQNLYLSLAREDARPLAKTLSSRPKIHPDNQWAMFVRNHDELTLDKLSDAEREEVFAAFGPDEDMQMYGRGLRRRLPTMLDGDPARIRMVYSLMFSLPGTPVLFYGEEIGMGEDLRRRAARPSAPPCNGTTPKTAASPPPRPKDLVAQVVDGYFGPKNVNAAAAKRDPESLWNFIATLIQRYRESPELGWGDFELIKQPAAKVLLHRCTWAGSTVVLAHNFGAEPASVAANAAAPAGRTRRPGFDGRRAAGPAGRRGHPAGGRRRFRAGAGPLRLPVVPGPAPGRTPHPLSAAAAPGLPASGAGRR